METVTVRDYFSPVHSFAPTQDVAVPSAAKRHSVSFTASSPRPHPTSRMSTHRLDSSRTNFAEVLHDNGGSEGLKNLDTDYFKTVLEVFRDRKQHHSPVDIPT